MFAARKLPASLIKKLLKLHRENISAPRLTDQNFFTASELQQFYLLYFMFYIRFQVSCLQEKSLEKNSPSNLVDFRYISNVYIYDKTYMQNFRSLKILRNTEFKQIRLE